MSERGVRWGGGGNYSRVSTPPSFLPPFLQFLGMRMWLPLLPHLSIHPSTRGTNWARRTDGTGVTQPTARERGREGVRPTGRLSLTHSAAAAARGGIGELLDHHRLSSELHSLISLE